MIAEQSIPVYTTLSDVFGSLTASLEHVSRWNNLIEEFEKRFGRKPTYIARAPGRIKYVNYRNITQILLFIAFQLDWWVYTVKFSMIDGLMLYARWTYWLRIVWSTPRCHWTGYFDRLCTPIQGLSSSTDECCLCRRKCRCWKFTSQIHSTVLCSRVDQIRWCPR